MVNNKITKVKVKVKINQKNHHHQKDCVINDVIIIKEKSKIF